MFGKPIHLFRLFGFAIRLDPSWFILAVLVAWSLAARIFPFRMPGLDQSTYWTMGVIGAAALFVSIILHECAHAVVARRYDIPIRGITLFIFGGVAEMESEPPSAKAEFLMAGAGPLASVALGAAGFAVIAAGLPLPAAATGVLSYVAQINLLLAFFNLVPAFPLDGGRMLRAALWHYRKSLRSATRTASRIGSAFGLVLMGLGLLALLQQQIISGIWFFLIGMFVRNIAKASYQQVLLRQALEGEPVRRFMQGTPITVAPELPVQELVDDYIYRYQHKLYPVVRNGTLLGCVGVDRVKSLPREEWGARTVGDIATECGIDGSIHPDDDAMNALAKMRRSGQSRVLVLDQGRLVGILTLRDLLDFFALKVDLEG
ncbi:MAG TPA: site-2 protease family protein [Gemmatimonadaceae bacterium]|nr:site-2 protease family protein [Gemmatimonadaceae bacterium]